MIAPLPFFLPPSMFLSTLSRLRNASDRPQAGSRGKNASLLIIQYARDAPGKRERERIYLPLPTRRLESISLGRRKNKKRNLSPFPLLFLSSKRKIFGSRTERAFKETFEFISNFFSPSKPEQNRCAPHFLHVLTPSGGA